MTEFGRGSFGERVIMTCIVCNNNHHDSAKEVYVQDPKTGAYARKICPLCMCLDCVQQHDDPIRQKVRPMMMGQTLQTNYNLEVDEFKPGTAGPVRKRIEITGPGPLNIQKAIANMQGALGLQNSVPPPPQHRLQQATGCGCGKNATSRCISCDVPLCMKCLKAHECEG